jgi:O-antigen/teichoic acid export membrane protein
VLLFDRTFKVVFLAVFPFVLVAVPFAREVLGLWLGGEFAENSGRVLQWLAVGVLINSVAQVPFTVVQAAGRPDLTAKLHLIELPFYLVAVGWLIVAFGIEGAAIAWVARVSVDLIVLLALTLRIMPASAPTVRQIVWTLGLALGTVAVATLPDSLPIKAAVVLLTFAALIPAVWYFFLTPAERAVVVRRRKRLEAEIASSA